MKTTVKPTLQGIGIASVLMLFSIAAFQIKINFQDVFGIIIVGGVCGFLPIVYQKDNIPQLLQIIIHLGGSALAFLIVAKINHWLPMNSAAIVSSLAIFSVIFIAVWSVYFIIDIQKSKKINTKLNNQ